MFAVIVLLAIVTAAVAMSLDEAVESISTVHRTQTHEVIRGGLEEGIDQALSQLEISDEAYLRDLGNQFDIFAGPIGNPGIMWDLVNGGAPFQYPNAPGSSFENAFNVTVGVVPTQRTRAPDGEDVTNAYGQVMEVQISVAPNPNNAGMAPAEQRVAVGVLIPRQQSQSQ